jgi:hypothetical protein
MNNMNKIYKSILKELKHSLIWDFITILTISPDLIDPIDYSETSKNKYVRYSISSERGPP